MGWLPLLNFIVQGLLLVALVWYTIETFKIRKATQRLMQLKRPWTRPLPHRRICVY
jgi:hypothetical protein